MRSGSAKNLKLATNYLDNEIREKGLDKQPPLNKRFLDKMMTVHET